MTIQLIARRRTLASIAREFFVSADTIARWAKYHGISTRRVAATTERATAAPDHAEAAE